MSGGVDSSVAACLLAGAGVRGRWARTCGSSTSTSVEHGCCGPAARADAAEVARIAGFPFEIVDLSDAFDGAVIDDFVAEHEARPHPEPVRAVQRRDQVRRVPATGRRAGRRPGRDRATTCGPSAATTARGACSAALDAGKDQTLHAPHARAAAAGAVAVPGRRACRRRRRARTRERFGLPVAAKPDSQELCFAPRRRRRRVRARRGARARRTRGRGRRRRRAGARRARRDLRRSRSASAAGSGVATGEPALRGRARRRARTASWSGPGSCSRAGGSSPTACSWVAGRPPADGPFEAEVRLRYRGEDVPAVVDARGRPARVTFARAAARRRARAERRRVPRRGAPRRRRGSSRRSAEAGRSLGYHRVPEARRSGEAPEAPAKSFDIQVQDIVLHITASDGVRRGIARGGPVVLGAAPVATRCATRRSARASGRSHDAADDAPRHRAGDGRRGDRAGGRPDVHVPGRGHRPGGPVPRASAVRGHGDLRRRLLHRGAQAGEARA